MSDQIDYFSICRRSQTRTHSNTERQVAAQPLRMNINNINNAVAFHSTHPAIHITLDEFKNVKRTGSRAKFFSSSIITSLNENLNTQEYDNWLSHSLRWRRKPYFFGMAIAWLHLLQWLKMLIIPNGGAQQKWEKIVLRLLLTKW